MLLSTEGSTWLYAALAFMVAQGCLFSSLVVPRLSKPSRRLLFLLNLVCTTYAIVTPEISSRGISYAIGALPSYTLYLAIDYILLTDVQHSFRAPGQTESISTSPLRQRIWWSIRLLSNPRGIGWNWEPRGVFSHPSKDMSPTAFIVKRACAAVAYYLLLDVVTLYIDTSPGFVYGINSQPWFWRCCDTLAHYTNFTAKFELACCVISIIRVGTGFAAPYGCPPALGPVKDAHSVKRFWGLFWQQFLRRSLSTPGTYLTKDFLQLPRGSSLAYYLKSFVSFTLSGLFHAVGDVKMVGHWNWPTIYFFLLQFGGILIEDLVVNIMLRMGALRGRTEELKWKWVGSLWLWMWLSATLPMATDILFVNMPQLVKTRVPFSLVRGILRGEWW